MVSREEIRWAYIMLLGREPESEEAYISHAHHESIFLLRSVILASDEGMSKVRRDIRSAIEECSFDYFRPLTIHLHIEKTGGTSLYEYIAPNFNQAAITHPHTTHIQGYSLGELNQLEFVSGHLTFGEAMALPRSHKTIICVLRNPIDRLISFYRFHRSHPREMRADPIVRLAQDNDPAAFFRIFEVRSSHRLFNAYVRQLGGLPDDAEDWDAGTMASATTRAVERMNQLSVVGVIESFDDVVVQLQNQVGLTIFGADRRSHSTDEIGKAEKFSAVPRIDMTDEIEEAIAPLVEFDQVIYGHAMNMGADRSARCTNGPMSKSRFWGASFSKRRMRRR